MKDFYLRVEWIDKNINELVDVEVYKVIASDEYGKPGPFRKFRWILVSYEGTNIYFTTKKRIREFFHYENDNFKSEIKFK